MKGQQTCGSLLQIQGVLVHLLHVFFLFFFLAEKMFSQIPITLAFSSISFHSLLPAPPLRSFITAALSSDADLG